MNQQQKTFRCIKSILQSSSSNNNSIIRTSSATTTTSINANNNKLILNTLTCKRYFSLLSNISLKERNSSTTNKASKHKTKQALEDRSLSNILNNNFNVDSIPKEGLSSPATSYIDPHNIRFDDEEDFISSSSSYSSSSLKKANNNNNKPKNNSTTINSTTTIDDDHDKTSTITNYSNYEQVLKKRNEIMDTLEFYRRMKKEGSMIHSNSLYQDGKQQSPLFEVYREVKFFLKANEKGSKTQLRVVETLLDKLVETIKEVGDIETARTLLNLLKKRIDNCNEMGLSSENIVQQLKLKPKITKLLQIIINTGDVTGAINFLRNAKNEHGQTAPYIGTSAFTVVLNGLIKEIKVFNPTCEHNLVVMKRAMELFNWMDESDQVLVPPDEFTFTTLIRGYALINDMSMAMELFNQMSTEYGMKPPTLTKAIIIEGFIKEGNIEKAFQFFKENCNEDFDGYYNSLITGFTHEGNLNKAFELVDEMKLKNISITTMTYNSFLLGLFRSKNYTQMDIDTILKTMSNSNLKPNSKTYSLIIRCLIQQGKLNEAIQYYSQHPEAILGAKTIAASLLKSGRLEEAENLMNQMLDTFKKYNIENHIMTSVLQYLIKVMLSIGAVKKASIWRKQISRIYKRE